MELSGGVACLSLGKNIVRCQIRAHDMASLLVMNIGRDRVLFTGHVTDCDYLCEEAYRGNHLCLGSACFLV